MQNDEKIIKRYEEMQYFKYKKKFYRILYDRTEMYMFYLFVATVTSAIRLAPT